MKTRNLIQTVTIVLCLLLIGNYSYGQITITVNSLPTPGITGFTDPTACGVNDGTITATGAGVGGSYSWNTTPVQTTATATGLAGGTYICTITNASGCSSTISQAIAAATAPTGTLASNDADNIFCAGTSVTFTVTTAATEVRFLVNGVETQTWSTTKTYPTTTLANGDIVSAEVRNVPACVGSVTGITNTVNALPTASFGVGVSICAGNSTPLVVTPLTGVSPWTITMTNGTGDLVLPNNTNPVIGATGATTFTVQPGATTTYHFTISDGNNCSTAY